MKIFYKGWYLLIYSDSIIRLRRLFFKETQGFAVWPFVVFPRRDKDDKSNKLILKMNHELIHLRQQLEMLLVFFYLFCFFEWVLYRCIKRKTVLQSYFLYSAEQEAYQNMTDSHYLQRRPFLRMFFYTKQKNKKPIEIVVANGRRRLLIEGHEVFPVE